MENKAIAFGLHGKLSRDESGKFPAYAWPGGYPIIFCQADGEVFCADCANQADCAEDITGADIFYEGAPEMCAGCGKLIESAYGDPDAE